MTDPGPRRPLSDVVRAGIGWGVVTALLLPVVVAWLFVTQDSPTSGGGSSLGTGSPGRSGPRRPRRALQYTITAITAAALILGALAVFVLVERARHRV